MRSFSVDCAGGSYDELTPARKTAHLLGAAHSEAAIGPHDFWHALPRALWHLDEPLADPAAIALYFAAALASGEVKAVLSGEGADEVFGGYEIYREPSAVAPLQWLPGPFKNAYQISRRLPAGTRAKAISRRAAPPLEKRYYGNAFIFTETEKSAAERGAVSRRLDAALDHCTVLPKKRRQRCNSQDAHLGSYLATGRHPPQRRIGSAPPIPWRSGCPISIIS